MLSGSISGFLLNLFPSYLRAPFIMALLACAAACGGAFAQSASPDVSQQPSQSQPTTQIAEIKPVPPSDRAYVGVYLGDLNAERARELGLKEIRGAVIGIVEEGSPAANAGLRENDVILAFNVERVQSRAHFYHLLVNSQPGSVVSLGISRDGAEQKLDVVLGHRRSNAQDPYLGANRQEMGVSLAPLTEQLADFFNASKDGMLITEVRAGEIGERAGLKTGDCIVTVDGKTIKSTSDIDRMLDQESSNELEFVIVRDRSQRTVKVKLDQK